MLNDDDSEERSAVSSPDGSSSTSSRSSHDEERPVLGRLVRYFVSAKRSLSSTHHVWRANEVVTASKAALEDIVGLDAKNQFLRTGVDRQVSKLRSIRDELEQVAHGVQDEFKVDPKIQAWRVWC